MNRPPWTRAMSVKSQGESQATRTPNQVGKGHLMEASLPHGGLLALRQAGGFRLAGEAASALVSS